MNPLLAITAARVGANILQNVAGNLSGPAASTESRTERGVEAARFSEVLARVASSPKAQQARLLQAEGIHDRATAEMRIGDYVREILQSDDAHKALAGDTGTFEVRVLPEGNVAICAADGRMRNIEGCADAKELGLKVRQILDAIGATTETLQVTPGGGVSLRQ